MSQFPHDYSATATAGPDGSVSLSSEGLPTLESQPPSVFGGPGDQWSPEDLLVAAVADCFTLSFRAIAAASKYSWNDLKCDVSGTLDREDRTVRFTSINVKAHLVIPADSDAERGEHLMAKAKQTCFITNSLIAETHLESNVETAEN